MKAKYLINFLNAQQSLVADNYEIDVEVHIYFKGEEKPWSVNIDWQDPSVSIEQTKSDIETIIESPYTEEEGIDNDILEMFYGHVGEEYKARQTDEYDMLLESLKKGIKNIEISAHFTGFVIER